MSETPSSKTQVRLLDLIGASHDGTYAHASRTLEAAGLPTDGLPLGETWRSVAKLSDADYLAKLPTTATLRQPVATTATIRRETAQTRRIEHAASEAYWADVRDGRIQRDELDEEDADQLAQRTVAAGTPGEPLIREG